MFLPIYQVLKHKQVQTIHGHSLDILQNTGVVIQHGKALKCLADAVAGVDFSKQRVFFQPELVERALVPDKPWQNVPYVTGSLQFLTSLFSHMMR